MFALSIEVDREIEIVLNREKFARAIPLERRAMILDVLRRTALWFDPTVRIKECRDPKDDKYLELAVASGAETIVSGDDDLLVLNPWRGVRIINPTNYLAETERSGPFL